MAEDLDAELAGRRRERIDMFWRQDFAKDFRYSQTWEIQKLLSALMLNFQSTKRKHMLDRQRNKPEFSWRTRNSPTGKWKLDKMAENLVATVLESASNTLSCFEQLFNAVDEIHAASKEHDKHPYRPNNNNKSCICFLGFLEQWCSTVTFTNLGVQLWNS